MKIINLLHIGQVLVAVLLTVSILLQNKGTGLSNIFGGSGNVYQTKRGLEKKLFITTIVLSILFFIISFATVIMAA
jgi:preprotein translocase subunit SecG